MVLISKEDARRVLGPHHDRILKCFDHAWGIWWDKVRPLLNTYSPRMRANVVHDLVADQARSLFGDLVGVTILEKQRFLLTFEDVIITQFKKLDSRMRTSNIATQLSLAFDAQQSIEGIPNGTRLTFGYVLNKAATEMKAIYVALLVKRRVRWAYEIEREAGAQVLVFPATPPLAPAPSIVVPANDGALPGRSRIRPPAHEEAERKAQEEAVRKAVEEAERIKAAGAEPDDSGKPGG